MYKLPEDFVKIKYGFRDKKPVHSYKLPSNVDAAASDLSSKAQSVFSVQGHLPKGTRNWREGDSWQAELHMQRTVLSAACKQ